MCDISEEFSKVLVEHHQTGRLFPLILVGAGVCLVLLAAWIGDHMDLKDSLYFDLRGESAVGKAERQPDGRYRISYQHPSGGIYARSNQSSLGPQTHKGASRTIRVKYDPRRPELFQPSGMSYFPAALTGALFLSGMALVLRGRRAFLKRRHSK